MVWQTAKCFILAVQSKETPPDEVLRSVSDGWVAYSTAAREECRRRWAQFDLTRMVAALLLFAVVLVVAIAALRCEAVIYGVSRKTPIAAHRFAHLA